MPVTPCNHNKASINISHHLFLWFFSLCAIPGYAYAHHTHTQQTPVQTTNTAIKISLRCRGMAEGTVWPKSGDKSSEKLSSQGKDLVSGSSTHHTICHISLTPKSCLQVETCNGLRCPLSPAITLGPRHTADLKGPGPLLCCYSFPVPSTLQEGKPMSSISVNHTLWFK